MNTSIHEFQYAVVSRVEKFQSHQKKDLIIRISNDTLGKVSFEGGIYLEAINSRSSKRLRSQAKRATTLSPDSFISALNTVGEKEYSGWRDFRVGGTVTNSLVPRPALLS